MASPTCSNFEVKINGIEKNIAPAKKSRKPHCTGNRIGVYKNIKKPVLIPIGGMIIFRITIGFLVFLILRKIISNAIINIPIEDKIGRFKPNDCNILCYPPVIFSMKFQLSIPYCPLYFLPLVKIHGTPRPTLPGILINSIYLIPLAHWLLHFSQLSEVTIFK
jgi:hypothetical protein